MTTVSRYSSSLIRTSRRYGPAIDALYKVKSNNTRLIRLALMSCCYAFSFSVPPPVIYGQEATIAKDYMNTYSAGAHCGVYSLAAALRILGKEPSLADLLSGEYISDSDGSSANDLCRAAKQSCVSAVAFHGLTTDFLAVKNTPALLLLPGNGRTMASNHWIAYLGDDRGMARIYDPPGPVRRVSYATLQVAWDGIGIRFDVLNGRRSLMIDAVSALRTPLCCLAVVVVCVGIAFGHPCDARRTSGSIRNVLCVVLGSLLIACAYHCFAPLGFARNPAAVWASMGGSRMRTELRKLSRQDVEDVVRSGHGLLVDARLPQAYAHGHIQGAINIPVNATLWDLEDASSRLYRYRPVVVYCESSACPWAADVANRLIGMGVQQVAIYQDGWHGWSSPISD